MIVAATGALAGAGYGVALWLVSSERFAVAEVAVEGAEAAAPDAVRERAGIHLGDNLFRVDLDRAERLVAVHPWVESARVRRELPDRIVVEVDEHRAAALADLGGLYLIDDAGVPFKRADVPAGETRDLVIVTGLPRDDYLADPDAGQAVLRRALDAAARYRKGDRPRLGEIHVAGGGGAGFTFVTYEGAVSIRVGEGGPEAAAKRLRAFDLAWDALSDDERDAARVVRIHGAPRPERVTVAFSELTAGN